MPRTALVVEDEPELGELFADILRMRGIDATVLHLGRPAPEWIRRHRPDLILLDLMLPDRDGYSVCEEVKLDRTTNLTPIVMVTARAGHADMVKGLAVGANEYVTKPFTVEQLNDAVDRAIAWKQDLLRTNAEGEIHFEIQSDTRFLEELNHMLASLFLYSGLPSDSVRQLTTAVRELGMNAIEWGHRKRADLPILVTYRIEKDKVTIVIKDRGPGFNPGNIPHAADPDDPVRHMDVRESLGLRAGGFGILMARGLVDELKYNDAGNEVRLVKHVTRREPRGML
jgi:CheY-like chemotaxis protein/anti-sigma regulatory factor (Ser/Thr protein kinase)